MRLIKFLGCLLIIIATAIHRDSKVLGYEIGASQQMKNDSAGINPMRSLGDDGWIINTASIAKDVTGYGGAVPLEIYINEGRVQKVVALPNSETPDFFSETASLLDSWNGKTLEEAAKLKVDAVSGATFSSTAIIQNMQRGLQYAQKNARQPSFWDQLHFSWSGVASLIVVLMAAIIPLFLKDKRYRMLQLALNVMVLGFWTGSFISYSLLVSYVSNGINPWTSIVPIVMLVTAFIYPFFGKKNYYCTHVCPCGSLQDLMGKTRTRKWKMRQRTVKRLETFRKVLWAVLMVLMATGVWASWMDYEIFVAFVFQAAGWVVLVFAALFMVLAIFVPRPYCRFVCPTGTLFKMIG